MTSGLQGSARSAAAADSGGRQMRNEIAEQANVLSRLVSRYELDVERIRALIPSHLAGVTFVARGSSRNAAMLGRYLVERAAQPPAALAAPALHTLCDSRVDHHGYLAIALSQSGATPEITTVLASMARTGARTIAITNDPCSPLAHVPDLVYPLDAGDELAVPATKTVTAQMFAVTVIASVFGAADVSESDLYALHELVRRVLDSSDAAERLAAAWAPSTARVVVVSRGYGYAAALEAALKITEGHRRARASVLGCRSTPRADRKRELEHAGADHRHRWPWSPRPRRPGSARPASWRSGRMVLIVTRGGPAVTRLPGRVAVGDPRDRPGAAAGAGTGTGSGGRS